MSDFSAVQLNYMEPYLGRSKLKNKWIPKTQQQFLFPGLLTVGKWLFSSA